MGTVALVVAVVVATARVVAVVRDVEVVEAGAARGAVEIAVLEVGGIVPVAVV